MQGNSDTTFRTLHESRLVLGHCFLQGALHVLLGLVSIFEWSTALFSIALRFATSLFTVEGLTGQPLRLEISVSLFFRNNSRRL